MMAIECSMMVVHPTASSRSGVIDAGYDPTCALLEGGDVRCWGSGAYGQLGYGNTEMIGDGDLPSDVDPVDLDIPAIQISIGYYFTCAVLEGGDGRCWGTGREALRMARTRFYAVVVTDLRMPGLDGLALIERLNPITPSTAFVLVSGMPELDLRANRQIDGAIAGVLAKPWEDEDLARTLDMAFALHFKRSTQNGQVPADGGTGGILLVEDNPADGDLIVALLAASLAFGNVKALCAKIKDALNRLGPHVAKTAHDAADVHRRLAGFRHRLYSGKDVAHLVVGARAMQRA